MKIQFLLGANELKSAYCAQKTLPWLHNGEFILHLY